jgi:hypothetical protein
MGVIKRGILGGFSNKVGNIVGSTWKGRAVVKSLPLSVANPRTTPQTNQRTKFKSAALFFSAILSTWIKPLWDRFSGDISGYNAVMKLNTELFSNAGIPDVANLVMSKGKMAQPVINTAVIDVSLGTLAINYTIPADATWGQAGESLFILAYNTSTEALLFVGEEIVDPSDTATFTTSDIDNYSVGDTVAIYLAIKRTDGTQVSNSTFTSTIVIA